MPANYVPVISATIAALTAVGGYLSAQRWKRRDDKVKLYADTLQAVRRYEELPVRISRRADSTPATRERLPGRSAIPSSNSATSAHCC